MVKKINRKHVFFICFLYVFTCFFLFLDSFIDIFLNVFFVWSEG